MSNPTAARKFLVNDLSVELHGTSEELAAAAAAAARDCLAAALAARGQAALILAAANSQIASLEALTQLGGVDWSRVTMFHMDEYLGISRDHPASFRRFLRERVEQRVRPAAFHYLEGDCEEPLRECQRYSELLAARAIDLCLLGIGENGHLAFNDPPVADFADPHRVKLVKLDEACRRQQVGEGHFPELNAVPQYAFTLTIPALCAVGRMICIVPDRRKAAAVQAALEGPIAPVCPASFLRKQAHCTLYLDRDSGSALAGLSSGHGG